MSTYTLTVTSAGPNYYSRYRATLTDDKSNREVASTFAGTLWGARRWGRKAARQHLAGVQSHKWVIRP
jgi:hypothetical protein